MKKMRFSLIRNCAFGRAPSRSRHMITWELTCMSSSMSHAEYSDAGSAATSMMPIFVSCQFSSANITKPTSRGVSITRRTERAVCVCLLYPVESDSCCASVSQATRESVSVRTTTRETCSRCDRASRTDASTPASDSERVLTSRVR